MGSHLNKHKSALVSDRLADNNHKEKIVYENNFEHTFAVKLVSILRC